MIYIWITHLDFWIFGSLLGFIYTWIVGQVWIALHVDNTKLRHQLRADARLSDGLIVLTTQSTRTPSELIYTWILVTFRLYIWILCLFRFTLVFRTFILLGFSTRLQFLRLCGSADIRYLDTWIYKKLKKETQYGRGRAQYITPVGALR